MPDNQIFKATYSGIPVYEMMCKGVAVMRRRSDSWLNATQILKVAGFDKPQRTRILEREVQKGEHEKVQGGYGKYQGTWIPLDRGLSLAKQYNCEIVLRPIIEFQPAAKSPPPAPKHLAASGTAARPARRTAAAAAAAESTPAVVPRSRRHIEGGDGSDQEALSEPGSEDGSMTSSPSRGSSSSRTPSPIDETYDLDVPKDRAHGDKRKGFKHHHERHDDAMEDHSLSNGGNDPRAYSDQILEYFISDTNQIPQILISPPPDFDPNMAIDDDGHTALHWASAMGRLRIVKFLLTAGADIFKVNKAGQTALMRSVMFANNYDVRKFPELYELLHRSTLNIDNYNRTVFHHIVDVAMSKGKTHAARYYMETVLNRLADYPKELADVINFQDEDGETALTMAVRCRSKRLVKLLIDHGADPKVRNRDGKSTEDYILEDERFRSSPGPISRLSAMSFRNAQASLPAGASASTLMNGDRPPLHHSLAGQKASTRCVNDITNMLDSLAASFDRELQEKERDVTQAHALLQNIQQEILESNRAVGQLKTRAEGLQVAKGMLAEMESQLLNTMGRRFRLGWEKWVKDEESRELHIRNAAGGELKITPATVPCWTDDGGMEVDGTTEPSKDKAKGKRKALPQEEDISDLLELYSNIPDDPEALRSTCEALRDELGHHRKRRRELFDEITVFQAEAGTGGRMGEYRRLIGAGCGGVQPTEVDSIISVLLETLESEESSISSIAWGGTKPGSVPAG